MVYVYIIYQFCMSGLIGLNVHLYDNNYACTRLRSISIDGMSLKEKNIFAQRISPPHGRTLHGVYLMGYTAET